MNVNHQMIHLNNVYRIQVDLWNVFNVNIKIMIQERMYKNMVSLKTKRKNLIISLFRKYLIFFYWDGRPRFEFHDPSTIKPTRTDEEPYCTCIISSDRNTDEHHHSSITKSLQMPRLSLRMNFFIHFHNSDAT